MLAMSEMPPMPNAGLIADLTGDAVVRVAARATVADVAKAIVDAHVGAVVVGDDARPVGLVGIVSARDLLGVYAADADQV